MEKIINNTPYNTADLVAISTWTTATSAETLYFSDCGHYLLHCIGEDAQMSNKYGSKIFSQEDLILLAEEDVIGWMKVHAPDTYTQLFSEDREKTA